MKRVNCVRLKDILTFQKRSLKLLEKKEEEKRNMVSFIDEEVMRRMKRTLKKY